MKSVVKDDELMLITTEGIIIRIRVNDTALLGRVTSGVKLIDLKSGVTVASIARVVEDKSLMPPEEEATEENDDIIVKWGRSIDSIAKELSIHQTVNSFNINRKRFC
mgnify:CR=1 FL=1